MKTLAESLFELVVLAELSGDADEHAVVMSARHGRSPDAADQVVRLEAVSARSAAHQRLFEALAALASRYDAPFVDALAVLAPTRNAHLVAPGKKTVGQSLLEVGVLAEANARAARYAVATSRHACADVADQSIRADAVHARAAAHQRLVDAIDALALAN